MPDPTDGGAWMQPLARYLARSGAPQLAAPHGGPKSDERDASHPGSTA
jgi:hypothetical protein